MESRRRQRASPALCCRRILTAFGRTKPLIPPRVDVPPPPPPSDDDGERCVPLRLGLDGLAHGGSLAVAVFVLVGHVSGEIAGPSSLLALVITMTVCLITGLCYTEFTSHYPTRQMQATAYHYVYILTGEFPAVLVGWLQIIVYLAVTATLSRTMSSTFIYIITDQSHNSTVDPVEEEVGDLTIFAKEPDYLAFGIVTCVALLVAIGGKPSSKSNGLFGVLSCAVVLAVIVLAGMQLSGRGYIFVGDIFPDGHRGVFRGAAIYVFLFSNYNVISTSAKNNRSSPSTVAHSLVISSIMNLIFQLLLTIFVMLVAPYPWTYGNPFVARLFGMYWGRGGMCAVGALCILCLGSALFSNASSLVYSVFLLGNDGVTLRLFGHIVSRVQTPVFCAIIAGMVAGIVSIFAKEDTLIELMAVGLLMKHMIICACCLSHRYQKIKLDLNENACFEELLRNGTATNGDVEKKKTGESRRLIPGRRRRTRLKNAAKSKDTPQATVDETPPQDNGKTVRFKDDTSESSGPSDVEETDIDAIVEEYQERARVASLTHFEGSPVGSLRNAPTVFTSNMAAGFSVCVCVCSAAVSALLAFRVPFLIEADPFTISAILVFLFSSIASLFVIMRQPAREIQPAFRTMLFPLLPSLGIFGNVFLFYFISAETWIVFIVCLAPGLFTYLFYGVCNSVEARRYAFHSPDEERILLPSIPEKAMNEELVSGQKREAQNIGYSDFHEETSH